MEQPLVDHVSHGKLLDLAAGDEEIDEAAMRFWGDSRACRASVVRDILLGRLAADPDPHGLRLRGARITGRIDLENLTTNVGFELTDCLLEEGLLARDARLFTLVLTGCQLEHPTEPPWTPPGSPAARYFQRGDLASARSPEPTEPANCPVTQA